MKIACVQMDVAFANPDKNFEAARRWIAQAAKEHADCIVLPEMWNTGYALDQLGIVADQNGQRTKQMLTELAIQYHVNIVGGSVAISREGQFYNTMYVVSRTGDILAEYDKAHLFKLMDEQLYMQPGQELNLFRLDDHPCCGLICYDIRFPEWVRTHMLTGSTVLFVSAEWPAQRIDHWQTLLRARAIENQCYVVAVNRVGRDSDNIFNGNSMVISPWGDCLISESAEEEGIYYATIDFELVESVRRSIPVFQDRRSELYRN